MAFKKTYIQPWQKNSDQKNFWQALQLFNLYRLALSFGFLAVTKFHLEINYFAVVNDLLYVQTSTLYFVVSVFFLLISLFFKKHYFWQANIPIFLDIIFLVVLMHASGGFISGVGILLIIIIAAHSLLIPGRLSLFSAALAVIGLLFEHGYSFLSHNVAIHMYTQAGLLGIAIFATALMTNFLSLRVRKGQIILETQAEQLATSLQLNAHIVSAMQEGVLVLDNHHQIRLINVAAKKLLGFETKNQHPYLNDLPLGLQHSFQEWQTLGTNNFFVKMELSAIKARLHFHQLGKGLPSGTLIFIYDALEEERRAQDLKLSSLGHLTANIAHELRNPLGAISHAAQLLAESDFIPREEHRLVKMIKQHCDRINATIQNVLSLSGRKPANTQKILLIPWLENFIKELSIPKIPNPKIELTYDQNNIAINIDPSQFSQILINLCENGLRYSMQKTGKPTITLRVQATINPLAIYLDVIDQGIGIDKEVAKHIFEPFYTTEKTGSGLGLYIANELSQMNGIRLDHFPNSHSGCQFRITFPQGVIL